MSGVLTRLVARATGTATAGLRPRTPSRFETAAPEASDRSFAEVTETVAAPASDDAEAPSFGRSRAGSPTPSSAAPVADRAATPVPPPLQPLQQGARADPSSPNPLRPIGRSPPSTAAAEASRDPSVPAAEVPAPLDEVLVPPDPERVLDTRLAAEPIPEARSASAAPSPLLAEPPRPSLAPSDATSIAPPAAAAATPNVAPLATPPEPPDIVISIGRIEVKGARESSARPERSRRPPPELTDLGDYLGGGGGKR